MESYNRVVFGLLKASGLTFVLKGYKPSSLQIALISFSLMCSQIHSQINAVFLSRLSRLHHAQTGGARNGMAGPGEFEAAHCPLTSFTNNNETGNNKA